MRRAASVAVMAALAFTGAAGAQAKPGPRVAGPAVKACKAERAADPAAFKTKYANRNGKRALRRCVRQRVRAARKACRAERKADPAAFKTKYANKRGKRALRRCVRSKVGQSLA